MIPRGDRQFLETPWYGHGKWSVTRDEKDTNMGDVTLNACLRHDGYGG
jgi:hypothetical protein